MDTTEQKSEFNLKSIFTMRMDGAEGNLLMGAFNGNIGITVFVDNKAAFRQTINPFVYACMTVGFNKVMKLQDNTKFPVFINTFNKERRKFEDNVFIAFGRGNEGEIFIELKDQSSAPMKFIFKLPGQYQVGSDNMPTRERSELALNSFIETVWKKIPDYMIAAKLNFEPIKRDGGNGGGYNRGGGSSSRRSDYEQSY